MSKINLKNPTPNPRPVPVLCERLYTGTELIKRRKNQDTVSYKDLNSKTQWELRKAYWRYIEDIFTPSSESDRGTGCMKRFWTYTKQ